MSFPCTSCSPTCLACNKQGEGSLLSFLSPSEQCFFYFRWSTFLVAICVRRPVETRFWSWHHRAKFLAGEKEGTGSFMGAVTVNSAWLGMTSNLCITTGSSLQENKVPSFLGTCKVLKTFSVYSAARSKPSSPISDSIFQQLASPCSSNCITELEWDRLRFEHLPCQYGQVT